MNEAKVLLCTLSVRTSQRTQKSYLSGWLGRSRLIGFQSAEPDRFGNVQFELYLQAVEQPRADKQRELVVADHEA